jgi:hypothetical protein
MDAPTRQFHIGDILSVSTGYMVSPTDFGAVHELIEYLVGGPVMTHSLVALAEPCKRAMLRQHPQLAGVDMTGITKENYPARLAEQVARFGEYLPVRPMTPDEFRPPEPLRDLYEIKPDARVILVEALEKQP